MDRSPTGALPTSLPFLPLPYLGRVRRFSDPLTMFSVQCPVSVFVRVGFQLASSRDSDPVMVMPMRADDEFGGRFKCNLSSFSRLFPSGRNRQSKLHF